MRVYSRTDSFDGLVNIRLSDFMTNTKLGVVRLLLGGTRMFSRTIVHVTEKTD